MSATLPPACVKTPPWSGKGLRRLSESLRLGTEPPANTPAYDDVLIWFDDLTAAVYGHLAAVDWSDVLGDDRVVQITSRAKTIDTLREKLQRTPDISLGYVQDVAGVRIEANMTLTEQDAVAEHVATLFGHGQDSVKDLREDAHSGYRAVHVWLRLPGGRVEVQVRTDSQGRWANAFESLADVYGRQIRYGGTVSHPSAQELIDQMRILSTETLARAERSIVAWVDLVARVEQTGRRAAKMIAEGHDLPEELVASIEEQKRSNAIKHESALELVAEYDQLLVDLDRQFRAMRRK